MHVIAESSDTKARWVLVEGGNVIDEAETSSLNPFFLNRREISHIIRLELPEGFLRRRWDHIYFYGAGCSNAVKNKVVESSVVAQFKTPTTVMSDMLGAARAMLGRQPGLVSILSTGANSCYYDGVNITSNVRPGGYLLGDEGSNSYMGRMLCGDILKGIAPETVIHNFYERFDTTADEMMDNIYTDPQTALTLAGYSIFLAENIGDGYCHDLVYRAFVSFFRRNIAFYDYQEMPLSVVGSTGCYYRDILEDAAREFGVRLGTVAPSSIPGLVEYHQ